MDRSLESRIYEFHGLSHASLRHKVLAKHRDAAFPVNASRRGSAFFKTGELRLVLLKLLSEDARHGYELIKAIENLSGGAYVPSSGSIYPALQIMLDEKVIDEAELAGEGRKPYYATRSGLDELQRREEELDAVMSRLAAIRTERSAAKQPQVDRAISNLCYVLRCKNVGQEQSDEMLHAIIDLIDETARRIERM